MAHWHPHLHLVVTDGAFRRDGSFVMQAAHEPAVLAEAWRRAVLGLFVRQGWLEEYAAASMLAWPHSGFSAHVGPAIAAEDRAAVLRVARYGARAPVAESRLRYDAERAEVELKSDASEGPYAGVPRFAAVEFLARLVDHIPGEGRGAGALLRSVREPARASIPRRTVGGSGGGVGAGRHGVRGAIEWSGRVRRPPVGGVCAAGWRGYCARGSAALG